MDKIFLLILLFMAQLVLAQPAPLAPTAKPAIPNPEPPPVPIIDNSVPLGNEVHEIGPTTPPLPTLTEPPKAPGWNAELVRYASSEYDLRFFNDLVFFLGSEEGQFANFTRYNNQAGTQIKHFRNFINYMDYRKSFPQIMWPKDKKTEDFKKNADAFKDTVGKIKDRRENIFPQHLRTIRKINQEYCAAHVAMYEAEIATNYNMKAEDLNYESACQIMDELVSRVKSVSDAIFDVPNPFLMDYLDFMTVRLYTAGTFVFIKKLNDEYIAIKAENEKIRTEYADVTNKIQGFEKTFTTSKQEQDQQMSGSLFSKFGLPVSTQVFVVQVLVIVLSVLCLAQIGMIVYLFKNR